MTTSTPQSATARTVERPDQHSSTPSTLYHEVDAHASETADGPRPLGVGFVGAGPVVQAIHLPTLARLSERLRPVHVMDIDADLARTVANGVGARSSDTLETLLADPAVDIVAICSPGFLHAEQAIAALRSGTRAVLVEKPYAESVEDAREVSRAARETGTPLLVGAMHLYDPGWTASAALREDMRVGTRVIRSSIVLPPNPRFEDAATEIVGRPATPPNVRDVPDAAFLRAMLLGLAIHDLPLIRQQLPHRGSAASLKGLDVLEAESLDGAGYMIRLLIEDVLVELHAQIPSPTEPEWTLDLVAPGRILRTEFPPSYVHAGSATSALCTADAIEVGERRPRNGYEGEWDLLARVVAGECPAPDLDAHVEDLRFALAIADRVDAHLAARPAAATAHPSEEIA
jgi:myo-inositol 2-dehydrogenase/D-chiro-inositol 1-dehydrogenase